MSSINLRYRFNINCGKKLKREEINNLVVSTGSHICHRFTGFSSGTQTNLTVPRFQLLCLKLITERLTCRTLADWSLSLLCDSSTDTWVKWNGNQWKLFTVETSAQRFITWLTSLQPKQQPVNCDITSWHCAGSWVLAWAWVTNIPIEPPISFSAPKQTELTIRGKLSEQQTCESQQISAYVCQRLRTCWGKKDKKKTAAANSHLCQQNTFMFIYLWTKIFISVQNYDEYVWWSLLVWFPQKC